MNIQDRFKFRWFDKTINFMAKVKSLDIEDDYAIVEYSFAESETPDDEVKISDGVLMQCLGKKDKTGKIAYEGDIVKYEEELYKIIWVQEDLHYYLERLDSNSIEESWVDLWNEYNLGNTEVEILGNIFENTELLINKEAK